MSDFYVAEVSFSEFWLVETTDGTEIVPVDVCETARGLGEYLSGKRLPGHANRPCRRKGWLYRLSAPGYMDCTDWGWEESEAEAWSALLAMYGTDSSDPADWDGWEAEAYEKSGEVPLA
jgi:hypothetical protein